MLKNYLLKINEAYQMEKNRQSSLAVAYLGILFLNLKCQRYILTERGIIKYKRYSLDPLSLLVHNDFCRFIGCLEAASLLQHIHIHINVDVKY